VARMTVHPGAHTLAVDAGSARHEFGVNVQGRYALVCIRILGSQAYLLSPPALTGREAREERKPHAGWAKMNASDWRAQ